jgi:putative transposase
MHLDEVFLTINDKTQYLWRAAPRGHPQHRNMLDILVQSHRNKATANKFFRKVLKGCQRSGSTRPRVLITDKLESYQAAKSGALLPAAASLESRGLACRANATIPDLE